MKVYFHELSKNKHGLYTYRTLETIMNHYGVECADEKEADIILISVDSATDLSAVKTARKLAGKRPLIAGGFECFVGEYLLAYCDALNVGEGFELFRTLAKAKSIEEIYELPCVWTREKSRVIPSTLIEQEILPVVRIADGSVYYLAARGCHGKCAFCITGFSYPLWVNDEGRLRQAEKISKSLKCKITYITNDSENIKIPGAAQSMRVRTYLGLDNYKRNGMMHFGVEGWTEERRKWFGKPISDGMITGLVETLIARNQQAELFFIGGFPNDRENMELFAENVMPVSLKMYPKIFLKITNFEPGPHTPLWSYPIDEIDYLNSDDGVKLFHLINQKNKTIRIFPVEYSTEALRRSVLRRCYWNEVDRFTTVKIPENRNDTNSYKKSIRTAGLGHLLVMSDRPAASSQIVMPHKQIRDRFADHLGMSKITYWNDSAANII